MSQTSLPQWTEWVTVVCNVFIALGTVGAAGAAVWLGVRADRPRLKWNTYLQLCHDSVLSNQPAESRTNTSAELIIECVNVGIPPVELGGLILCIPQVSAPNTQVQVLISLGGKSSQSRALERGEKATGRVTVLSGTKAWTNLPFRVWRWNAPYFLAMTTTRKLYKVRVPREQVKIILEQLA
jgi:hypothetical protein